MKKKYKSIEEFKAAVIKKWDKRGLERDSDGGSGEDFVEAILYLLDHFDEDELIFTIKEIGQMIDESFEV